MSKILTKTLKSIIFPSQLILFIWLMVFRFFLQLLFSGFISLPLLIWSRNFTSAPDQARKNGLEKQ